MELNKYGSPEHNYDDWHTLKLYDDMKLLSGTTKGGERENSKRSGVCEEHGQCVLYMSEKMPEPCEVMTLQTKAMIGKWMFSIAIKVTEDFVSGWGVEEEARSLGSGDCRTCQPPSEVRKGEGRAKSRSTLVAGLASDHTYRSQVCWLTSSSQDSGGRRTRSSRSPRITQQDFASTTKK